MSELVGKWVDLLDEATFNLAVGEVDKCIEILDSILKEFPDNLEAHLALGMAFCRKGDYEHAVQEGLIAEKLDANDERVQTNLSLFYIKMGDKKNAETHVVKAKLISWKKGGKAVPPSSMSSSDETLKMFVSKPTEPQVFTGKKGE